MTKVVVRLPSTIVGLPLSHRNLEIGCYLPWQLYFRDTSQILVETWHSWVIRLARGLISFFKVYIHFKQKEKGLSIIGFLT